MTQINLSLKQKQTHRHRDQICGCQQGGRGEQGWTRNLELAAAAAAKSLQSCRILCDPMDCSQAASSVHGILQARILEWVPCPLSGDLPDPGIKPQSLMSPALAGGFFTTSATWEAPH